MARWVACSVSLVSALESRPNVIIARLRNLPLFSMATMVLSKVGAEGLFAIASISFICSAMPLAMAGLKSLERILLNSGAWNESGLGASSGLTWVAVFAAVTVPDAAVEAVL